MAPFGKANFSMFFSAFIDKAVVFRLSGVRVLIRNTPRGRSSLQGIHGLRLPVRQSIPRIHTRSLRSYHAKCLRRRSRTLVHIASTHALPFPFTSNASNPAVSEA